MAFQKTEDGAITEQQYHRIEALNVQAWNDFDSLKGKSENSKRPVSGSDLINTKEYRSVIEKCDEVIKVCVDACRIKKLPFGVNTYQINYYVGFVSLKADLYSLTQQFESAIGTYKLLIEYPQAVNHFNGQFGIATVYWNISQQYYEWSKQLDQQTNLTGKILHFKLALTHLVKNILEYRSQINKSSDARKYLKEASSLFIIWIKEYALLNNVQHAGQQEAQLDIVDLLPKQNETWRQTIAEKFSEDQLISCFNNPARIACGQFENRIKIITQIQEELDKSKQGASDSILEPSTNRETKRLRVGDDEQDSSNPLSLVINEGGQARLSSKKSRQQNPEVGANPIQDQQESGFHEIDTPDLLPRKESITDFSASIFAQFGLQDIESGASMGENPFLEFLGNGKK